MKEAMREKAEKLMNKLCQTEEVANGEDKKWLQKSWVAILINIRDGKGNSRELKNKLDDIEKEYNIRMLKYEV